ncbi:major facilitator superfamily domain-containing protein [Boletus edulis BED1]|uniref:Major facilitator superfamily domain-containing protein n=1 Tax=Boletus edulis BED1 TaxID=1328754 RepID=A0AAD4GGF6_BOLED|nr:major facilitator superfamily domain-containing protein [Boletus edulis BED1]
MSIQSQDRRPDEETPLLQAKSKTPVPWSQIILVFIAMVAEPISSAYIFPFINQLIGELGITEGDNRKIGYYAGFIESLFFFTQALTTWQWCRLSDFIGRRPVILTGLLGLTVSTFAFGLSRTLGTLIISRCIAGILNGNIGVMKGMLSDLTDHTNMAQVFTLVPPIFSVGFTIAVNFGQRTRTSSRLWYRGVASCWRIWFVAIENGQKVPDQISPAIENPPNDPAVNDALPIPMLTIVKTYSVMLPIVNYGLLGLIVIGFLALFPLFCSSPIEIGGLGLPPPIIGAFLAILGIVDGSFQALFGAKLIEWLGAKKVYCWAVLFNYPLIMLFPIMSAVVTARGTVGPVIWILLVIQLICFVFMDLSFSVLFMFITRAAPNKQSLGSVHGLSQSLTSAARAIGPVLMTSLFAVSKEYNILGGNLVYVILVILTAILVMLSRRLPTLKNDE